MAARSTPCGSSGFDGTRDVGLSLCHEITERQHEQAGKHHGEGKRRYRRSESTRALPEDADDNGADETSEGTDGADETDARGRCRAGQER